MSANRYKSVSSLRSQVVKLRRTLEQVFAPDTAQGARRGAPPSYGHCAAVAALVYERMGGTLVSTVFANKSHWFNRLPVGNGLIDVDLTGDQFGRDAVQIAPPGQLYNHTKERSFNELNLETRARAQALRQRAEAQRATVRRRKTRPGLATVQHETKRDG
jgi:hypothetical protein